MRLLVKEGFSLAVGLGHIYTVNINLLRLFGIALIRKLIAVKHMHPCVLLGKLALAALVNMKVLYRRRIYGFLILTLLRQQRQPIKIERFSLFPPKFLKAARIRATASDRANGI